MKPSVLESLRVELSVLMAEQGEALRRAVELRKGGASAEEVSTAIRCVERIEAQINCLRKQIQLLNPFRAV
jgi:conjugal transfer/entry exclusion protein